VFGEVKYDSPGEILDKLLKAEVDDTSGKDLAKVQSGIVRKLRKLRKRRDMLG